MFPLVVSYFTKDSLYEKEAENLILSCNKFNLDYHIEAAPSFGSWEKNCCFKPFFLLEKLYQLQKPLLWIDVDAVFVQKPKEEQWEKSCDIAVRFFESNRIADKTFSGTVFINYTPKSIQLLHMWSDECEKQFLNRTMESIWDQACLSHVIHKQNHGAKIMPLPLGYSYIFDEIQKIDCKELFIVHYQASRLYRKVIDQELENFSFLDSLSPKELRNIRTGNTNLSSS